MLKVWFWRTANGNDVVADIVRSLPAKDRKIVGRDLKRLQFSFPMGPPLCKHLEGPIWELRSSLSSKREMRLLYRFDASTQQIVVVHAFIKKTGTTPKAAIKLALTR